MLSIHLIIGAIIGIWLLEFLIVSYEKFLIIKKIKNSSKIEINNINQDSLIKRHFTCNNMNTSHHFNNELFCYFVSNLKNKIKIVNFASKKINKDEKNLKIIFLLKYLLKENYQFFSSVSAILKKKMRYL